MGPVEWPIIRDANPSVNGTPGEARKKSGVTRGGQMGGSPKSLIGLVQGYGPGGRKNWVNLGKQVLLLYYGGGRSGRARGRS